LIAALVLEDPARAFKLADHRTRLQPIFESWAWKDFAAAEKAAIEAKRSRQREAVIGLARMKATQLPFEEALAWASSFEALPEVAMTTTDRRKSV
jgi:hypothetical protein